MKPQTCTCTVCREAITNPVCPDCLTKEAKVWLREHSPSTKITEPVAFLHSASRCVICGSPMAMCAHCYSNDMFSEIAAQNPAIATDFARVFNFELA